MLKLFIELARVYLLISDMFIISFSDPKAWPKSVWQTIINTWVLNINIMDIENSNLIKETINFVENIKFSEFQPKIEIKEEEGLDQEVWKSSPFDVKVEKI